jgi:hypothetical protein
MVSRQRRMVTFGLSASPASAAVLASSGDPSSASAPARMKSNPMDTLINVVTPVFGLILTGCLAGRSEVLGPESAAALTRFVYYFAFPAALFVFSARAPMDKTFNWPFIWAIVCGS